MRDDARQLQQQLDEARCDLARARAALIELPAARYRPVLSSYSTLRAGECAGPWASEVAERIVEMYTPPTDGRPNLLGTVRVLCPLCGGGGEHIYGEIGFSYPEGLRRHLAGDMNAHMCEVMNAAKGLAREHFAQLKDKGHS